MRKIFFNLICLIISLQSFAQDSALNSISNSLTAEHGTHFVTGTFKALYIVNMKTVEAPAAGALNFEIQHRFGTINEGAYHLWGLDFATLRLGLDYGISDRLSVGIGRSSVLETFDGYVKYKLLRQTDNPASVPVSIALLGTTDYYTDKISNPKLDSVFKSAYRLSYTAQILIARKFSNRFSLQITPTFIHYNLVDSTTDHNNVFALSAGGRFKITKRMAITAEYNYLFPNQLNSYNGLPLYNALSFGWDIETGGHVFQLVFTNAQTMNEPQYIGQTVGSWGKGDIYFGFNISRIFNLKPHNKPKG
jgi:opacity protein-like surface antigen